MAILLSKNIAQCDDRARPRGATTARRDDRAAVGWAWTGRNLILDEALGGGVLLYIKDTIPAYEVQLQEEADCNEAIWCNLVTGHTTVIIGVVYRCPNIAKQNNEKIHNAINEVSKGDCIIMGDFNHGNIKWDTLQSTGVEDSTFLCLVQDNFLTQHVLEPTSAAR